MQYREIFGVPLYRNKFDRHEEFKEQYVEFLKQPELYERNSSRDSLQLSHPNLHKEEILKPLVDFIQESLQNAMIDLGFVPNIELTGLWSTIHPKGGFHHRHSHFNSYLGGVYYLSGGSNCGGTTFLNTSHYHNLIYPARLKNTTCKFKNSFESTFEEGNMVIFPAWLPHSTPVNTNDEDRIVLAFNSMPIGKTTQDTYDRYNFQSVKDAEMISYNDERIR